MRVLTDEELKDYAEPIRSSIFTLDYQLPFTEKITERLILFYCRLYECVSPNALVTAAASVGDEGILFFPSLLRDVCAYIPLPEFDAYINGPPEQSNRAKLVVKNYIDDAGTLFEEMGCNPYGPDLYLCSPTGKWGIYVDFGGVGFLGGSPEFMNVIRQNTPGLDDQVIEFLKRMRQDCKPSIYDDNWVMSVLLHIYDKESVTEMIEKVYAMSEEEAQW